MTAYFTEPMSDEFKKALAEALREIEDASSMKRDKASRSSSKNRSQTKKSENNKRRKRSSKTKEESKNIAL